MSSGACVYSGNVQLALDLKNNHTFWVLLGRSTPWVSEESPPDEDLYTTDIEEVQGAKKCDLVSLCIPSESGGIEFQDQSYTLVSDEDAYTSGARWVYFRADLKYDQFPVVTYRQTGLYLDLTPTEGNEGKEILLPSEIQSNGILLYYRNHPPRYRTSDSVDVIEIVIEVQGRNL